MVHWPNVPIGQAYMRESLEFQWLACASLRPDKTAMAGSYRPTRTIVREPLWVVPQIDRHTASREA